MLAKCVSARGGGSSLRDACALILVGALCMLALQALPARGEGVPASFDCGKAERTVERLICADAGLRWQDLALARSYRAAREDASAAGREGLLAEQRAWLAERDRGCVGTASFEDMRGAAGSRAARCLARAVLQRRRALQMRSAALAATEAREIDLAPIRQARPDAFVDGNLVIAAASLSPDGKLLALLLPSRELDFPDQAWLLSIATGELRPATPLPPTGEPPYPPGSPAAITQTAWKDGVFHARVALWNTTGDGEEGQTTVYAATLAGQRDLGQVEGSLHDLLQRSDRRHDAVEQADVPERQWDMLDDIRANDRHLVWHEDRGQGTVELATRGRGAGAATRLVAWGGPELAGYLFDADASLVTYPGDTGLMLFDLEHGRERRISGTSPGDRPLAASLATGRLAWTTANRCGEERIEAPDDALPRRVCVAGLRPFVPPPTAPAASASPATAARPSRPMTGVH